MKNVVFLTGAGMSAESGIPTFRASDGLWENHKITDVATPDAWHRNPALVLDFYNERRKKLFESEPNAGHTKIVELEKYFDVQIITQNIDDLHEKAGSKCVLHLHGELKKARSTVDAKLIYTLDQWQLNLGDTCEKGSQLRPHIVWFGEAVPEISVATLMVQTADMVVVVGTSLNVYPAAGLLDFVKPNVPIYVIDPGSPLIPSNQNIKHIKQIASIGLTQLYKILLKQNQ